MIQHISIVENFKFQYKWHKWFPQVRNLVASVNGEQGFRIKGWFKPAATEDGVTDEIFSIHVCSFSPVRPLTDEQKKTDVRSHFG